MAEIATKHRPFVKTPTTAKSLSSRDKAKPHAV